MRRSALAIIVLCAPLALLATGCEPATVDVAMRDNFFSPATATIPRGGTVRWTNEGFQVHSATSNSPFPFWNSGDLSRGGTYSTVFRAGGTYPYYCDVHNNMFGTVKVPIAVSPASGSASTTFTVTVASAAAQSGFEYVLQKMDPGGTFQPFRTLTSRSTTFQTSTPGTHQFRAQLRRIATGTTSDFSDPVSITVG